MGGDGSLPVGLVKADIVCVHDWLKLVTAFDDTIGGTMP